MALNVQLVIQGGGAKIVSIIAVLEAVQELQAVGKIKVKRIAGASAGALAGCLFAAGVSMKEVRRRLQGPEGADLIAAFKVPSMGGVYYSLIRGKPIWSTKPLESFVSDLLGDAKGWTLKDLSERKGIEMLVVTTTLGDTKMAEVSLNTSIISAVMDSAGLPFLFRVWGTGNHPVFVDGGICENLPVMDLHKKEEKDGPIATIAFRPERDGNPDSIFSFMRSLLNSAINNSMSRAREALRPDDILEISSEIGLVEFGKAFTIGLGDSYTLQKERADRFFEAFIKRHSVSTKDRLAGNPWLETNPVSLDLMEKIGQIYDQFRDTLFKYHSCTMSATLFSLRDPDDARVERPDIFNYALNFEPTGQPIHCLGIGVSMGSRDDLNSKTWKLYPLQEGEVKMISVPVRRPAYPDEVEVVHFFDRSLTKGKYVASYTDESREAMPKLLTGERKDELVLIPRHADGPVSKINLIVCLPDNSRCANARMIQRGEGEGRTMLEGEIRELVGLIPPGFRPLGWTITNAESNKEIGVDVVL